MKYTIHMLLLWPNFLFLVKPCEIQPCKNNGVCVNEKSGKFTCKCLAGYGGTFCDRRGW